MEGIINWKWFSHIRTYLQLQWVTHCMGLTAFSCFCSKIKSYACTVISTWQSFLLLKHFHGAPMKIYLHEHLTHEYFHTRKFPDLQYFTLGSVMYTNYLIQLVTAFHENGKLCCIRFVALPNHYGYLWSEVWKCCIILCVITNKLFPYKASVRYKPCYEVYHTATRTLTL